MSLTVPADPVVELLVNGTWIDITADCRLSSADSGGGITITRGRPNEGNTAEPTEMNFTLNNGASKVASTLGQLAVYSPRNPNGPYYGYLGRNQRVRVGLTRWSDSFNRTAVVDGWGWLPDHTSPDLTTIPGEKWKITGTASNFDITGTTATIQAIAGNQYATFGTYGDVEVKAKIKTSTRDSEFGLMLRAKTTMMATPVGISNPNFETAVSGWIPSAGSVVRSTAQFHSGAASALVTVAGSPVTLSLLPAATADSMYGPIVINGSYKLRYWVRTSIGMTVQMNIQWYNQSLASINTATSNVVLVANTWTLCELTATAPQDAYYARIGPIMQGSPANGTLMFLDDLEFVDMSREQWYSVYITPGGTDQLRIGKVSIPGVTRSVNQDLVTNILANTDYWFRGQITGQRIRCKIWKATDTEPLLWTTRYFDDVTVAETEMPLYGEVGFIVKDGASLITIDSVEVNQWRAHAEIAELPPRWDLSRSDRWIPIKARGMLRRLGQGRKALKSAVTLFLQQYSGSSYGWWTLEDDTDSTSESAGNQIAGAPAAAVSGLDYQTPELTGLTNYPGVAGYATLSADTSAFIASIPYHTNAGYEAIAFNWKVPAAPVSDILLVTFFATGTARSFRLYMQLDLNFRFESVSGNGTILDTGFFGVYFNPDQPTGCWINMVLQIDDISTPGTLKWEIIHHRPGNDIFYGGNGSFAGSFGVFTSLTFRSSSVHTAAGSLSLSQVLHYAGNFSDLFLTYDFADAVNAYIGELAAARWLRLTANAAISGTTIGDEDDSEPMGAQLPNKLLDLLEECANVEDGIVFEERDDFGLALVTRASMWNRIKRIMDIDLGHMSEPLEPTDDDQSSRNDITVSRPSGGFARSVQESGPLNTNSPEDDPLNGIGTYDEAPVINFAADSQLLPAANFRRGRGTQDDVRYPSIHADLTSTAYRVDSRAVTILGADAGDILEIDNPEITADPSEQQIASYTEDIDQYDYDVTFVAAPASVYRVGVVGYTTRIASESNETSSSFVSGTDTKLMSTLADPLGYAWQTLTGGANQSFPFDVDVSGVRLRVTAVGDVLNGNPSMESGVSGWLPTSANVTVNPDRFSPKYGTQCMRIQSAAAGTDGAVQDSTASCITVAATDYYISGWIKTDYASADCRLAVDWYQSNNTTFISTSLPTALVMVSNVWTWFEAVVTSPALGARARLKTRNVFTGIQRLWCDDLRIMPVSSYASDPQTLTVEQAPVNGIIKTIPVGEVIRVAAPWRVGW